ncbi:uncharacterized protein G2W53_028920 [Senna tora]|uniref:Uncharacterized protein n=1 Tax=Senna tora TaxID=362788 RepID=A0A834T694_9FABA|nr:uncharacterized protein G2W53_028920 [Senna tora]
MPSRFIGNPSGSNARMGLVVAWEVCQVMYKHILNGKQQLNLKRMHKFKRVVAQVSHTNACALYWKSEWI